MDLQYELGRVAQVTGLLIESDGPHVRLGDVCEIRSPRHGMSVFAEVVGFREHRVLFMPLGEMDGIHPGCEVRVGAQLNTVPEGEALLGRVLDGLGRPIDNRGPLGAPKSNALRRQPPNPLLRQRIDAPLETGVRAIDATVFCGNPCCVCQLSKTYWLGARSGSSARAGGAAAMRDARKTRRPERRIQG